MMVVSLKHKRDCRSTKLSTPNSKKKREKYKSSANHQLKVTGVWDRKQSEKFEHTWMTLTRVSGYLSKIDSKAVAGRRRIVEGTAALADTVLYGAGYP